MCFCLDLFEIYISCAYNDVLITQLLLYAHLKCICRGTQTSTDAQGKFFLSVKMHLFRVWLLHFVHINYSEHFRIVNNMSTSL